MLPKSDAKIFLANERGFNQTDWYRSYNTFNFGFYHHEHKAPFSDLYVWNDDTLAPGKNISMQVEKASVVVLIAIVGTIEYADSYGNTGNLTPGQSVVLNMQPASGFKVENPYEINLVNFLHLWIKCPPTTLYISPLIVDFNTAKYKNQLLQLFATKNTGRTIHGFIAQFDGRQELIFKVSEPGNAVFAFVIDGAFEFQYRLLHPRDGIVIWNVSEVEMEALSNEAIIVLVEIPV